MLDAGFLVVWNDIAPEVEAEYQRWHRVEHMAERMAVPGFTLGRRYWDRGGSRYRYLTVYEGRSVETFRSEPYRARLAAPTPWTTRMSAHMDNFIRRVCRTVASEGAAIGGAAATFRCQLADVHGCAPVAPAAELVRAAIGVDGAVGAHLGLVDAEITGMRTDGMQSRSSAGAGPFNAVLIVESDSRAVLADRLPELRRLLAKFVVDDKAIAAQVYDLALLFQASGGRN